MPENPETMTTTESGADDPLSGQTLDQLPGTELLPEINDDLVAYESADLDDKQKIEILMKEINLGDSKSIIFYGSKAQEQLTTISDNMLEGVRNKDMGSAGNSLNNMVSVLRGFDLDGLPDKKPGFFARLFGKGRPIAQFIQQYETVRQQIDGITDELEGHKTQLLTDITSLDRLYDANLEYFHELKLYIAAGEEKLKIIDEQYIPAMEAKVQETEEVLRAQQLRDMRSDRDDLERRVHDLKLTKQVAMQGLPSIRLVQENDKGLVNKIGSTLVNTVPLWRNQLAQAVTIYRSGRAAESVEAATDLTNELLEKNAENLKVANAKIREQLERGVFDIESVKKANQDLIDTIEESMRMAEAGKKARADAEVQLVAMESELSATLAAAKAREQPTATETTSPPPLPDEKPSSSGGV